MEILYSYGRSEEHTSELQSPVPISYAVFCLKKKNNSFSLYQKQDQLSKLGSATTALDFQASAVSE